MKYTMMLKPFGLLFLLCMLPLWAAAQTITVRGTVKDNAGEAIIGANVVQTGTTNGTITDFNGNYTLKVPANASLKISFVGYEPRLVSVAGRHNINVVLRDDSKVLNEVVVVGYGQMKRSDLTGSVVSVSNEAIKKSVATSIDQVLQGRAAGVQVQMNSGSPGAGSAIRIRGINSLNATCQPIFVIDGVVVDGSTEGVNDNPLSTINPSDIVSMDVLKDASATAIYGSRAANGVILISTRRGTKGDAHITYDGYGGVQQMPKKLELLNLQEYAAHQNTLAKLGLTSFDDNFVSAKDLGEGTNWQDALFQNALITSHNIGATGGTERSNFALGAGFLDQDGIARGSAFTRFSLRSNVDCLVKDWAKVGMNFAVSDARQKVGCDNDVILTALRQTPNVSIFKADGTYDGPHTSLSNKDVQSNPIGLASLTENKKKVADLRGDVYVDLSLVKDRLSFKTEFSFDYSVASTYYYLPSYAFGTVTNDQRTSTRSKATSEYYCWRNVGTYQNLIDKVHSINIMVGHEMSNTNYEYLGGTRSGFLSNIAHDLDAGNATTALNSNHSYDNSILSFFGRAFYSYDDRYLLTATIREDGSSQFAKGHQWGMFPSGAFGWKVSNEKFMKDFKFINSLKLRLGYGAVGNQNVEQWAFASTMKAITNNWGGGLNYMNMGNEDLTWETTYAANAGFDLNMFKNRVELVFDVYYKKTKNLLLELALPAYMGTTGSGSMEAPWANVGSLINKGIEATINTINYDKKGFSWKSNIVFSMNKNEVSELNIQSGVVDRTMTDPNGVSTVVTRTVVGQPIGQFYGYKVIGRFNSMTDFYYKDASGKVKEVPRPEGTTISEKSVWLGDYIFEDVNGDGVINANDQTFIGDPNPLFTFGFGNTFSYKNWDFTIYLNGSYGNDVLNYVRRWSEEPSQTTNLFKSALDYPVVKGTDNNATISGGDEHMYRLSATNANTNNRMSNRYIEDGSYIRIQNISFGYTFPRKITRKFSAEAARVYVNLQNVYTFTKYKGYDPEVGCYGSDALLQGVDYGRYPSARIFTAGLSLTF